MDSKIIFVGVVTAILLSGFALIIFQQVRLDQISSNDEQLRSQLSKLNSLIIKFNNTLTTLQNTNKIQTSILNGTINDIGNQLDNLERNNLPLNADKIALEKKYSDLFSKYSALIGLFNSGNTTSLRAKWVINEPVIDGVAQDGEWSDFNAYELKYSGVWNSTGPAIPWDTKDKLLLCSIMRDDKNIYICAKFDAKYLSTKINRAYFEVTFYDNSNITDDRNTIWDKQYDGGTWSIRSLPGG